MTEEPSQNTGEFEREPVPQSSLLGFKSFVGMYAGEHCAGTELMIGPLFVASGVSAVDVLWGLLIGNFLAVLSWRYLTAPIATRARLTLYYQLEKICGRQLVTLYNLANGVMFCFLAGSMITVSATAVGVWFDFPMPGLNDIYPNSVGWVLAVVAVGAVISVVAAFGYETVARFANLAAPWMVLVFFIFGLVALSELGVTSFAEFWPKAKEVIWTGGDPLPGQTKFNFWHVMFFAWFANMAMHIGMSDLTIFRFAKKSWYGYASAAGMYVGHFMAWLAASMLYAEYLQSPASQKMLAAGEAPPVLPGPLAYNACGVAGLLCVIIAGWTTANPTIYRAGLAFQAMVPNSSRFRVTLFTGAVATIAGVFPAIAMKLLGFVAIYGMILMPMGAVVFVDFWLMRRMGLEDNFAERRGLSFNWAAGLTWFISLAACVGLVTSNIEINGVKPFQLYFVSLPGWFLAAILYLAISYIYQNEIAHASWFRIAAKTLAWISLAGLLIPACLLLLGKQDLDQVKSWLISATILWFVTAPLASPLPGPSEN